MCVFSRVLHKYGGHQSNRGGIKGGCYFYLYARLEITMIFRFLLQIQFNCECVQKMEGKKEDSIKSQRQIIKYKNYKQRKGKRNKF